MIGTHAGTTMHIVRVFPISRGMPKETLSYFSPEPFTPGTLLQVPLRNKQVPALVVETVDAHKNKAYIKSADYELKKLQTQEARHVFTPSFLAAVEDIAAFSVASPGAVFYELVPQAILNNIADIQTPDGDGSPTNLHAPPLHIIQAPEEDRYTEYVNIVRSAFARNQSVYITAPTQKDIEKITSFFNNRIRKHSYIFHSDIRDSEVVKRWNRAISSEHPVVIVATPYFLSLPRSDIQTIIVEREGDDSYKQTFRPFLDMRSVIQILGDKTKAQRVFGDTVLRVATIWRYKEGSVQALSTQFRYQHNIQKLLVDMKQHQSTQDDDFALFSEPLDQALTRAWEENTHIFLFTARKGLYPFTVCGDCGEMVTCNKCSYPLVVKRDEDKRRFVCNRCKHDEKTERVCTNCGSWKLWPLGIGIDRIADELQDRFPDLPVFQIDSDTVKSKKEADKIADSFYQSDCGVLLSTRMGMRFLKQVDTAGIVSIDSFLSLPDIDIQESVFHLIIELQSRTKERLIVQTRMKNTDVLEAALAGNVTKFYRDEIQTRKSLSYPPFSILIKITIRETADISKKKVAELVAKTKSYEPQTYRAFTPKQRGKDVRHVLISIPRETWPDEELIALLRSLDPTYEINVEPKSLL